MICRYPKLTTNIFHLDLRMIVVFVEGHGLEEPFAGAFHTEHCQKNLQCKHLVYHFALEIFTFCFEFDATLSIFNFSLVVFSWLSCNFTESWDGPRSHYLWWKLPRITPIVLPRSVKKKGSKQIILKSGQIPRNKPLKDLINKRVEILPSKSTLRIFADILRKNIFENISKWFFCNPTKISIFKAINKDNIAEYEILWCL